MALVESLKLNIGSVMHHFNLSDPTGKNINSENHVGDNGMMIVFTCNHCPYAIAVWPRLISLSKEILKNGVTTLAINPNIHPNYPADSASAMTQKISEWNIPFPYLVDEDQTVATSYKAQCTPDIYVVKNDMTLFYHGRIDDNWKNEKDVKHYELSEAIDALINKKPAPSKQIPSMGCSIKWKN